MDKIMTVEERIRRAEQIYNRRRNNEIRISKTNINEKRVSLSLFKKMVIQILVCLVIYGSFYLIKNKNYFFSETVINKTHELLKNDINFEQVYNQVINYIDKNKEKLNIINLKENEQTDKNKIEESIDKTTESNVDEENKELENNAKEEKKTDKKEEQKTTDQQRKEETVREEKNESNSVKKSQNETDVEYVKANAKFIKPVEGEITSKFRKKRSN